MGGAHHNSTVLYCFVLLFHSSAPQFYVMLYGSISPFSIPLYFYNICYKNFILQCYTTHIPTTMTPKEVHYHD